jgi:hypothetical protein
MPSVYSSENLADISYLLFLNIYSGYYIIELFVSFELNKAFWF